MVVRVIGKVDGKEVIFNHVGGNQWDVIVPADMDGEYILEATAYDEFGNVGFMTRYLFTVRLDDLICTLLPLNYYAHYLGKNYSAAPVLERFCSVLLPKSYKCSFISAEKG